METLMNTENRKMAFITGLIRVACADGILDTRELHMLEFWRSVLKIEKSVDEMIKDNPDTSHTPLTFDSPACAEEFFVGSVENGAYQW